jgi:mycothiol synthase
MDLTWRALTLSDAAQLARLSAAAEEVDQTGENYGEEDFVEHLGYPLLDLARGSQGVFDGETLVGSCTVNARTAADPIHRMHCDGVVDPAYRRRGLGAKLLAWACAAAVPIHERHFPGQPLELLLGTDETNEGLRAMVLAAGFEPVRWFFEMRHDLGAAEAGADGAAAPALAEGLTEVVFQSEYDQPLFLAHNAAFVDHWGSVPQTEETWRHSVTGSRSFRPELSFLALDQATGEVAGYIISEHFEADTEKTGVKEVYLAGIGTRRAWRRKGVAGALIADCLAEAARLGYQRASLGVDADNPTGALGVYQRAGFYQHRKSVAYVLKLQD